MKQLFCGASAGTARRQVRALFLSAGLTALVSASFAVPASATARGERAEQIPSRERTERRPQKAQELPAKPNGPLLVIVSTDRQRVTVWSADGKVTDAPVSTGREGYETPHGVFSVLGKEVEHFSNLYDDAPMPYMQRLTWSGVALHAGRLPGYPASHGCVRLGYGFSKQLFGITSVGTRVIVTDEDVAPKPFSHPKLFTPLPALQATSALPPASGTVAEGYMEPTRLALPAGEGDAPAAAPEAAKGVVVANAGPDMGPAKRTRQTIVAERAAALADANTKLAAADARARELGPLAKSANATAFEAAKAMRVARIAAERASEDARKASARITAAKSELLALARLKERARGEAAPMKAAQREQALEERLGALSEELAKAQAIEAEARSTLDAAQARVQRLDIERAAAHGALTGAMESLALAKDAVDKMKREDANRTRPISVLISRKTGKLHVRQGFEDLFDTPINIEDPEQPFGTHVLTAAAKGQSADELRWSVVTLQGGQEAPVLKPRKSRRGQEAAAQAVKPEPSTAARALDRVTIPDAAAERIAELVKPGSSIIISDQGPSRETGKGTDFVVLTR